MTKIALRLWLALWKRAVPTTSLPAGGLTVRPLASDAGVRALGSWTPTWKTQAIAAILQHRPGTFIDVGANVGQTLLDFLSAPVRFAYVGFEPNLTCAKHLSDLISHNRLESCRIIPAALGDSTGVTTLYSYGGEVDSGATTRKSLRPDWPAVAAPVCIFRMDDLIEALPRSAISLVKIDAEGSELEVLRGMEQTLKSAAPWLLCEVLHRDASADPDDYRLRIHELMQFLRRASYNAFRIRENAEGSEICGLEPVSTFPDMMWHSGSAAECDYLFVPVPESAEAHQVLGG